jgi:hypothetical protein
LKTVNVAGDFARFALVNRVASVSVRKGKKPGRLCEGLDFGGSVTGGVQPVEGEVIVWL